MANRKTIYPVEQLITVASCCSRFDLGKTGGMFYTKMGDHIITDFEDTHLNPDIFSLNNKKGQVEVKVSGLYKFEFSLATDYRQIFMTKKSNQMFSRVCLRVNGESKLSASKIAQSSILTGSALLPLKEGDTIELTAEWNSLSSQLNSSRLYFGGQLLQ